MGWSKLHQGVPLSLSSTGCASVPGEANANFVRGCGTSTDELSDNISSCVHINKDDREKLRPQQTAFLEMSIVASFIEWAGQNSLEIYVLHGLYLHLLKSTAPVLINNASGFLFVLFNFAITMACVFIMVSLIKKNDVLNKLLFWKASVHKK